MRKRPTVSDAPPKPSIPTELVRRAADPAVVSRLVSQGIDPLLAALFAARGVNDVGDVRAGLDALHPVDELKNAREMASLLADCVASRKRVLIVSDYDCDGATACSILLMAFRECGIDHDFLVPDRRADGYGLSEAIVRKIDRLHPRPDYIITVDNGVSSHAGVDLANRMGFEVLVTDHHLAPDVLPAARLIVNPNQPKCRFPSKNIAGCGVAWYIASALADEIERRGCQRPYDPADLLCYVALGTVADVVRLDRNNRILVRHGLDNIRSGRCSPGIVALAQIANVQLPYLSCADIGFNIAPKINAAGRLEHMSAGIIALTTDDPRMAMELAIRLERINIERKEIQKAMVHDAERVMESALRATAQSGAPDGSRSIVLYNASWNEGVVGIVAGRLKDDRHRPTIVFCRAQDGTIKGSGRSIPGFHLKHALDRINVAFPGLIEKFGGHGPAAGLTIAADRFEEFRRVFEAECAAELQPDHLVKRLVHDGELDAALLNRETLRMLDAEVWGQGFEPPMFVDRVTVNGYKRQGKGEHLKINASRGDTHFEIAAFGMGHLAGTLPGELTVAYTPQVRNFNGKETIQLRLEHMPDHPPAAEPAPVANAAVTAPAALRFKPAPQLTF